MCSVRPPNSKDHHCEIHIRALIGHLGGCETNHHSWKSRFLYNLAGYFLWDLDALCIILVMQAATDIDKFPSHIPIKCADGFCSMLQTTCNNHHLYPFICNAWFTEF